MKSYIVKEREDGTRYFDENTPAGNINPDVVGNGLEYSGGKLSVDAAELAGAGLTEEDGKLKVDSSTLTDVVHLAGTESITGAKTFTASPQVPTATTGDSSTKVANTAFVAGAIAANDANVVHRTGNETVAGSKIFTNGLAIRQSNNAGGSIYIRGMNSEKGAEKPVACTMSMWVHDKDGDDTTHRFGGVGAGVNSEGRSYVTMNAYKDEAGSTDVSSLAIYYPRNADPYTSAPTPALTSNTSNIATTRWVKQIFPNKNGFLLKSDGTIEVDFGSMDQDTIDNIRRQMGVKVLLRGNTGFYVNVNTGSDTLDEGRGESADKPFKTIQACVNYISDVYDVGAYIAYINVAAGTYNEDNIVLRDVSSSSGSVRLRGASKETCILNGHITTASTNSCSYYVTGFTIANTGKPTTGSSVTEYCIWVSAGKLYVTDVILNIANALASGVTALVPFFSSGGTLGLYYATGTSPITVNVSIPTLSSFMYASNNSGAITISQDINVTGAFALTVGFARVYAGAQVTVTRPSSKPSYPAIITSGTITGKRYIVSLNGIVTGSRSTTFFPGTEDGTTATGGQYE